MPRRKKEEGQKKWKGKSKKENVEAQKRHTKLISMLCECEIKV